MTFRKEHTMQNPEIEILRDILDKADNAYRTGDIQAAYAYYTIVGSTIDQRLQEEDRNAAIGGAVIGGIVGVLIPLANVVMVPLCAWVGYRLARYTGNEQLNGEYGDLLRQAVRGAIDCEDRMRNRR